MKNKFEKIIETSQGGYLAVGGETLVKKFSQSDQPQENLSGCSEFLQREFKKLVRNPKRKKCLEIIQQAVEKYNLKAENFGLILEALVKIIAQKKNRSEIKEVYFSAAEDYINQRLEL